MDGHPSYAYRFAYGCASVVIGTTVHVGPPIVTRQILPEDSCVGFFWDTGREAEDNATYNRPDPFGFTDYNVPYSLNKIKRWTIPSRLRENIVQLQDPHHNLRVSASTHEFDRADHKGLRKMNWESSTPSRSYHTVSRDGATVINRYAKKGYVTLRNLIEPWKIAKPWDSRKDEWKRKHQHLPWCFGPNTFLDEEEDVKDQKMHVLYSTVELVSRATAHNGLPRKRKAQDKKMKNRSMRKHRAWTIEPFRESDLDDDEDEVGEEGESRLHNLALPSIASFLVPRVPKKPANGRRPRSKREPFKDEPFSYSSLFSSSREMLVEASIEDEKGVAGEDVVIVESPSTIVLVAALPQLYTKIRMSDSELESLTSLPVYPRSWMVHREATAQVLGRDFPICIVAKEMTNGEIGLFGHENCLSCADRWGRFRILFEGADAVAPLCARESTPCIICCREMAVDSVFEHERPFSLACGHMCCTGCWLRMISDGMKRDRVPASCPEPSCRLTLSVAAASALLDLTSLRKYTDSVIEVLLRQQKIVRCSDCSRQHRVESRHGHPLFLAKCPTCGELGEPMEEGCGLYVRCVCDEWFCYTRGQKSHGYCDATNMQKTVILVDVSTLYNAMITRAIDARLLCIERRKQVMGRLNSLSIKNRKEFDRTFTRLSHLMQICYLNSAKSRRSLVLAERIQLAMSYFFNTEDKNRRNLLHKIEMITKIFNDITTELFEGVSVAHRKRKKVLHLRQNGERYLWMTELCCAAVITHCRFNDVPMGK